MTKVEKLQLFDEKEIRTVWDDKTEKYYFSVVDVVSALSGSVDPRKYWSVLKNRLKKEGVELTTICSKLKLTAADGKKYLSDVTDQEQLLRLIQSIPSPKAEPFKLWLARVGSERLDEIQDPELAIDRAMDYYRKRGYSEGWINERMKGKEARKALTDEWKRTGVKDTQYATLTDILTREWSGMSTKEYKGFKGLKKENLRDHMSATETALNTLAEVATKELSQKYNPRNFEQNKKVARGGGSVAKAARDKLEEHLGRSVLTSQNALGLNSPDDRKEIE